MANTTRFDLQEWATSQSQPWVAVNTANRDIDQLLAPSVIDRALTAPPGTPNEGDAYIPASVASGGWLGQEDKLAFYSNGAWVFKSIPVGMLVYDQSDDTVYAWDGAAMNAVGSGSGGGSASNLDDLSDVSGASGATLGQALLSNGAGGWSPGDVATGGGGSVGPLELVESIDATNSGVNDLSQLVIAVNGEDELIIDVEGLSTSGASFPWIRVSQDGGSTYLNTNADYSYTTTGEAIGEYFNDVESSNATGIYIGEATTSGIHHSFTHIMGLQLGARSYFHSSCFSAGGSSRINHGRVENTAVITHLAIDANAGTFDGGTIRVYKRAAASISSGGGATNVFAAVTFSPDSGGGAPTIDTSYNISAVTRTNAGRFRIEFDSDAADTNYFVVGTARYNDAADDVVASIGYDRRAGQSKSTAHVNITVSFAEASLSDNIDTIDLIVFKSVAEGLTDSGDGFGSGASIARPRLSDFPIEYKAGTGDGTFTDVSNQGFVIHATTGAGSNSIMRLKTAAVPGTGTDVYTARLKYSTKDTSGSEFPSGGFEIRNSSNGRRIFFGFLQLTGSNALSVAGETRNDTSFNGALGTNADVSENNDIYFRLEISSAGAVDGSYSLDGGAHWWPQFSTTLATFVEAAGGTFDQIGFSARTNNESESSLLVHFYSEDGTIETPVVTGDTNVGWEEIGQYDFGVSGGSAAEFLNVGEYTDIEIYGSQITMTSAGYRRVQYSVDNGVSWYNTSGDYYTIEDTGVRTARTNAGSHSTASSAARDSFSQLSCNIDGHPKIFRHVSTTRPGMFNASLNVVNAIRMVTQDAGGTPIAATSGIVYARGRRS